jgi:hypothetical protein
MRHRFPVVRVKFYWGNNFTKVGYDSTGEAIVRALGKPWPRRSVED